MVFFVWYFLRAGRRPEADKQVIVCVALRRKFYFCGFLRFQSPSSSRWRCACASFLGQNTHALQRIITFHAALYCNCNTSVFPYEDAEAEAAPFYTDHFRWQIYDVLVVVPERR